MAGRLDLCLVWFEIGLVWFGLVGVVFEDLFGFGVSFCCVLGYDMIQMLIVFGWLVSGSIWHGFG